MILWIILLIVSAAVFLLIAMLLLPRLLLQSRYTLGSTMDRGLKRYRLSANGQGIVYEPNLMVRRYIKQYVITTDRGRKLLKCKVGDKVSYLEYDVVLFNASNKVFKVLSVNELIRQRGYTDIIELPEETSYVTLVLNRVDNRKFNKTSCARVSPLKIFLYGLAMIPLTVIEALVINLCFSKIFGGLFKESYLMATEENLLVLFVALGAGIIGTTVLSIILTVLNRKK